MTYGGDTDIPCTYTETPDGFTEDSVTDADLRAAGFFSQSSAVERTPGTPPAQELLVPDSTIKVGPVEANTILAGSVFRALRNREGVIVATWDEGRWWTPEESDAFIAAMVRELEDS